MKPEKLSEDLYLFDSGCFLSNMYLLLPSTPGEERRAVIIDPWQSEEACELLRQKGVSQLLLLLTHEHYDHTTGVNFLREHFDCTLVCQANCAANIAKLRNNRPLGIMGREEELPIMRRIGPYVCAADRTFNRELRIPWDKRDIAMIHTPGHAKGGCSILFDRFCFPGDNALLDLPTITRFFGGSQTEYDNLALPFLLSLPEDTLFLPGHGENYLRSEVQYSNGCFSRKQGRTKE